MSQQKNQERPRLLFEEEEREDKVEKDFVESKETHEGNVVSFNSLREEEENKHERDEGGGERGGATAGGEWIEHERSSPFHEENSRPSMSSTAGKGLFARCYNMSNSTTSFTFKVHIHQIHSECIYLLLANKVNMCTWLTLKIQY